MRQRDPRRVARRRRQAKARVQIMRVPESSAPPDGSVTSKQVADVTLPRAELERIWSPQYLERLAATYWRFLTRISLGLLRVLYTPVSREIVLLARPFVLLRFKAPEYEASGNRGTVTWRIDQGLLVAPAGRGRGYLRICVERPENDDGGSEITGRVTSEVANFYPTIAGWGWFARIGRHLYRVTQLKIHVVITHAFLRSLARLDLAPSKIGALVPRDTVSSYWRLHPADQDPEELLDPENQISEPWNGADHGHCDKCDGTGEVEHECESCSRDGARADCPACHGQVTYVDECPACRGSGHITDSRREGVSVFPDCDGLVRYMDRRDTELTGNVLLELEGEKSGDRDFDADEGAILIRPRRILSREPVDERRARELREQAGLV